MTTTQTARDKAFQDEMQALLTGDKTAEDKTLRHFIGRFKQAQAEFDTHATNIRNMETQLAELRATQAKLTGYLEGLAIDLRHVWDDLNPAAKEEKQPPAK